MSKIKMDFEQKTALFIAGKQVTDYIFDYVLKRDNEIILYSDTVVNIYDTNTGEKIFEYTKKEGDIFEFTTEDFFCIKNDDKVWLYTTKGKIFSKNPFDRLYIPRGHDVLRRIIVYEDDKCGVYSFEGDKILECDYDDICLFKNAIKARLEDGTVHLYSLNGDLIFTAKERDEWRTEPAGIVKRNSNNKCGLYSIEGKVILPEIYDEILFSDMYKYNKIEWIKVQKDGKYGVVDFNGNEILPIEFDQIQLGEGVPHSPHDYILVKKNNKYGIYSNDGRLQVPVEYEYFKYYNQDDRCLVYNEGISGYYIIPKKRFVAADNINITKTGIYEFLIDGQWKALDI